MITPCARIRLGKRADLFVTYCAHVRAARKAEPTIAGVKAPAQFDVDAAYGPEVAMGAQMESSLLKSVTR